MNTSSRFLNRDHSGIIELLNRCLDISAVLIAATVVSHTEFSPDTNQHDWITLILVNSLITMLFFQQSELYRSWRGRPYSDQFSRLLLAWSLSSAATVLVWHLLDFQSVIGPIMLISWLSLGLLLTVTQRALLYLSIRIYRKRGKNQKLILIYGAGALGQSIQNQCLRSPESGFKIIGFLDDDLKLRGGERSGVPIIGGLTMLQATLESQPTDELWIALPLSATEKLTEILEIAEKKHCSVRLFPDLLGLTLLNHSVSELLGFPIIDLNIDRMQGLNRWLKELEDKVLGISFFIVALPFVALIAMLIKLTSPGPILFKQRRIGWDGKPFTIYKFRTMIDHDELTGTLSQARRNDGRFTPIGRWLRRFSLDEIPQIYNVLQGRMSLVGPRPHAVEHDSMYQQQIQGYIRRNRVKPGITGWAQINDLRGEIETLDDMARRVKHDLYYIEHWSLWLDVRILLATCLKVFLSKKAW